MTLFAACGVYGKIRQKNLFRLFVDNASPNMPEYDLDAMVQQYQILYIKNKENKGYNAGNNVASQKLWSLNAMPS